MTPKKDAGLLDQDVLVGMGLGDLPDKEKEELTDAMISAVQGRIVARCMRKLSPEEIADLDGMMDAPDENKDAVMAFLQAKIPDLDEVMKEEAMDFKRKMLEDAKAVQETLEESGE